MWIPGLSSELRGFHLAPQLNLRSRLPAVGVSTVMGCQLETSNTDFLLGNLVVREGVRVKFYNWRNTGWTQENVSLAGWLSTWKCGGVLQHSLLCGIL